MSKDTAVKNAEMLAEQLTKATGSDAEVAIVNDGRCKKEVAVLVGGETVFSFSGPDWYWLETTTSEAVNAYFALKWCFKFGKSAISGT